MNKNRNDSESEENSDIPGDNYEILPSDTTQEYEDFYAELADYGKNGRITLHKKHRVKDEYTIIRKKDVKIVHSPTLVSMDHPEYNYHGLAGSRHKRNMRSFIITLRGKGETRKFASHKGEEFILVQKGTIKVVLKDREETLYEGDSIYYQARIPHRLENLDEDHSIILAVFYGS